MSALGLLAVRTRWQRMLQEPRAGLLRIGVLASYTIDPVLPYLGVALADAGLPATLTTGPFNQIVAECLAADSAMARLRPDILVVAPRFEELSPEPADYPRELLDVVEVAMAAADRWRAVLIVVLPAVPQTRAFGVLDETEPGSVPMAAASARHTARAAVAGTRNCYLVDAEQAVRAVGEHRALAGGMFRFARIPYTEPVFAELGRRLAGVVRAVYGATPRAAVLDGDWFGGIIGAGASDAAAEVLAGQLRLLGRAGLRLGLVAGDTGIGELSEALPEFTGGLLDAWVLDERPITERLDELAAALDVPAGEQMVLTGETAVDRLAGRFNTVALAGDPDTWPQALLDAGLLDRLPAVLPPAQPAPTAGDPPAASTAPTVPPLTLREYIAGLRVEVTCEPVRADTLDKVTEVVSRAKDFTLGRFDLPRGSGGESLAIRVSDRLGRYGISGAVSLRYPPGECVVEVFSLSCPVLGKGVQDAVLKKIIANARAAGASRVRMPYRVTGHNQVAVDFLTATAAGTSEPELIAEVLT